MKKAKSGFQICDASCGIPEDETVYPSWEAAAQAALDAAGLIICTADVEDAAE